MTAGQYDGRAPPWPACNFAVNSPFPATGGREPARGRRTQDPVESLQTLVHTRRAHSRNGWAGPSGTDGLVLGRYRLRERLGTGGFGVVWRAHDELLHREVAVKRIPLAPDGDRDRASREALATARLAHPAIVALYEACAVQDAFYLISELVRGETLAQLIAARSLADQEVLEIGIALAGALSHAHSRGVIHRDVKPQNVLVPRQLDEPGGVAKLTDFGGAHLAGADVLTCTGDVLGTLAYMAPEQSEGREVGEAADLYALALVLYEALSGVNPVRGPTPAATARRIGRPLAPLERTRGDLPRALTRALDTALAPSPTDRRTLDRLRLALEETLERGLRSRRGRSRLQRRHEVTAEDHGAPAHQSDPVERAVLEPLPVRDRPRGPERDGAIDDEPSSAPTRRRALPRGVWLAAGFAAIVWQVWVGHPGAALLAFAAFLPLAAFSRSQTHGHTGRGAGSDGAASAGRGPGWPACVLAPVLGLAGLAGAFPAIAGQATRWRKRAAIGALGYWWLTLAEPLFARHLWLGEPAGTPARAVWEGSLSSAAVHVVGPMLSLGVLFGAALWATGSVFLPWLVRGRSAVLDVIAATTWSAVIVAAAPVLDSGLFNGAAHPSPRGAILGAMLGGMLAVAARALRGPV
jgi:eukaryotic-like serine/threonine-protein kinase